MRISDWSSDVCSSDLDLNQLGYDLLRHKRPADAVTVFGLLTRAYPGKANSYDSLADGYEAPGKREDANAAMRKAVALDPASPQYPRHPAKLTAGKNCIFYLFIESKKSSLVFASF